MRFPCFAALLLSTVAAHPSEKQQSVSHPPADETREGPGQFDPFWPGWDSANASPIWPCEMPPWSPNHPSQGPGNENPQKPIGVGDRSDCQPGGPSQIPERNDRQVPDFRYMPDKPGASRGSGRRPGRPRGLPRGGRPNMRDPNGRQGKFPSEPSGDRDRALFDGIFFGGNPLLPDMVGNRVFVSIFKVGSLHYLNNVTGLPLTEGENVFLLPRGGKAPPHSKERHHRFQRKEQYLKLFYNPAVTNKVSLEYGILKPLKPH
ncbi:hypothetical protein LDENG_00193610 [Lucifuga dentata]|nr:hypothetical protein LDENG_00193610 [Lucifuga dentata]